MPSNLLIPQLNNEPSVKTVDYKKSNGFDNSVIYAVKSVHALPPKGKMVSSSLLTAPYRAVKDTCEDAVFLSKAVTTGKSDDYKLGRVNDLALKLGSLGIAGYLFTKRPKTSQKYMELIGFGSFFASMALWPKLFIQAPAKLVHGIDVFQEYEDSQGRRKRFYQDPQYIPWDIISPKEMDKMGDRLNIPKNIKNRSDLTKEKAHKVALQSNTMWMLSAGFGVPIMSAFICSGLEKLLPDVIAKHKTKKSNAKVQQLLKADLKDIKVNNDKVDVFNNFVSKLKSEPVNDATLKNLSLAITGDASYSEILFKEMQANPLFTGKKSVGSSLVDKVFEKFADDFDAKGIKKETVVANYAQYKNMPEAQQVHFFVKSLQNSSEAAKHDSFSDVVKFINRKGLTSEPLSQEALNKAKELNQIFAKFDTIQQTFTENLLLKSASSSEASGTKYWEDFSKALVKVFNFDDKQVKALSSSDAKGVELIGNVLTKSLATDSAYTSKFNSLLDVYSGFAKEFGLNVEYRDNYFRNGSSSVLTSMSKDRDNIFDTFGKVAKALKGAGFEDTAQHIVVTDKSGVVMRDAISQAGSVALKTLDIPTTAKFSAFSRNLLTLDFYKRKADGTLIDQVKRLAKVNNFKDTILDSTEISDQVAKGYVDQAEKILLKGELSDFVTKFNTKGDAGLNYRVVMNLLFNPENLSDVTQKIFTAGGKEKPEFKLFKQFLNGMHDTIGNLFNPHFRTIVTDVSATNNYMGNSPYKIKPAIYQSMVGDNTPSMLKKAYESMTNTKIWTKKFAALGVGVAAVTVLSQFLFGKINTKNVVKNDTKEAA